MDNHIITGKIGENITINYLVNKGYRIIESNYRNSIGEIDIIAQDKNIIVFIEVKTSSSLRFGRPKERINFYKINKIKNVALCYLKQNKLYDKVSIRFDCIEIVGDKLNYEIEHLENIF